MEKFWDNFIKYLNEVSNLDWLSNNLTDFQIFLGSILTLAIVALWCFLDILGSLFSMFILKYTDIESKYPRFKKIIQYYNNVNYVYIIYQALFLVLVYLIIIVIMINLLYKSFV